MLLLSTVYCVETLLDPRLTIGVEGESFLGIGNLGSDILEFNVETLHTLVPLLGCWIEVDERAQSRGRAAQGRGLSALVATEGCTDAVEALLDFLCVSEHFEFLLQFLLFALLQAPLVELL